MATRHEKRRLSAELQWDFHNKDRQPLTAFLPLETKEAPPLKYGPTSW